MGYKALGLKHMVKYGYHVPEGFTLTTELFAVQPALTYKPVYDDTIAQTIQHRHVLEVLWSQHEKLGGLVRRRLGGIRVASHPACHYCKVFPDEVVGDSENFMIPEDLLADTGVIKTGLYNEKTGHCGAGFRQRFVNPSIAMAVTRER